MDGQSRGLGLIALMLFYVGSMVLLSPLAPYFFQLEAAKGNTNVGGTSGLLFIMVMIWIVLTVIVLPLGWVLLGLLFPEFRPKTKRTKA